MTVWQVNAGLPEDLAAFVHLLDADQALVSQHDGFDAAPATLLPGDLVLQRHVLPLPEGGLPAEASLQIGLYSRSSGLRLRLDAPPDAAVPDRVVIGAFADVD